LGTLVLEAKHGKVRLTPILKTPIQMGGGVVATTRRPVFFSEKLVFTLFTFCRR